jgi:hypothetical protein
MCSTGGTTGGPKLVDLALQVSLGSLDTTNR